MKTLKNILKEDLILEMSIPKKSFKDKIENLSQQILENWCLVRFCKLTNRTTLKTHWSYEFRNHILSLMRYKIKQNNDYENRLKVVKEVWDELEYNTDTNVINMTVNNKFRKEDIDTKSQEYYQVLEDCMNESNTIIDLIAKADINLLDDYVDGL